MMPRHDWIARGPSDASGTGPPTGLDVAARMLAFAQARSAAFAPFDLIVNDIAWELLLASFVAQERGQPVSIAALCDTLDLPRMVPVRWLRALGAAGLIDYSDEKDGQSALVQLTPAADQVLRQLIEG